MSNNIYYLILFIVIGGLFIGLGFARIWTSESRIKRPKVHGQKREYFTMGEIWMQQLKAKLRK